MMLTEGLLCQGKPVARGTSFRWPKDAPHRYDNPTDRWQSILCVDSPPFLEHDLALELDLRARDRDHAAALGDQPRGERAPDAAARAGDEHALGTAHLAAQEGLGGGGMKGGSGLTSAGAASTSISSCSRKGGESTQRIDCQRSVGLS